jgi:hypothetical protein
MSMHMHNSLRARGNEILSEEALRKFVPSLYAEAPHDSRSERYAYIPSIAVMAGLQKEGFLPVAARQSNPRDEGRREHTKHMVRFRYQGTSLLAVGDTVPEIVLVNSHDGTSSYNLMAGLFRLVCLNGMVVNAGNIANVRVQHSGKSEKIVQDVIEGAYTVLSESVKALDAPKNWSQLQLTHGEREILAEGAHTLRFADAEGNVETPIKPTQLLVPRRYADNPKDLWTTFNVIQENVMRGGLSAWGRDANNRPRRSTTRQVNGIDQDVRLNKALWTLGERMAQLKQVA